MRRELLTTTAFRRALRRAASKDQRLARQIRQTLAILAEDAFHPRLRTHKLKGDLAGLWAASAGYDLRVVFEIVEREGAESVLLLSVGTHDEVY